MALQKFWQEEPFRFPYHRKFGVQSGEKSRNAAKCLSAVSNGLPSGLQKWSRHTEFLHSRSSGLLPEFITCHILPSAKMGPPYGIFAY